jgi:hypothetical protein
MKASMARAFERRNEEHVKVARGDIGGDMKKRVKEN